MLRFRDIDSLEEPKRVKTPCIDSKYEVRQSEANLGHGRSTTAKVGRRKIVCDFDLRSIRSDSDRSSSIRSGSEDDDISTSSVSSTDENYARFKRRLQKKKPKKSKQKISSTLKDSLDLSVSASTCFTKEETFTPPKKSSRDGPAPPSSSIDAHQTMITLRVSTSKQAKKNLTQQIVEDHPFPSQTSVPVDIEHRETRVGGLVEDFKRRKQAKKEEAMKNLFDGMSNPIKKPLQGNLREPIVHAKKTSTKQEERNKPYQEPNAAIQPEKAIGMDLKQNAFIELEDCKCLAEARSKLSKPSQIPSSRIPVPSTSSAPNTAKWASGIITLKADEVPVVENNRETTLDKIKCLEPEAGDVQAKTEYFMATTASKDSVKMTSIESEERAPSFTYANTSKPKVVPSSRRVSIRVVTASTSHQAGAAHKGGYSYSALKSAKGHTTPTSQSNTTQPKQSGTAEVQITSSKNSTAERTKAQVKLHKARKDQDIKSNNKNELLLFSTEEEERLRISLAKLDSRLLKLALQDKTSKPTSADFSRSPAPKPGTSSSSASAKERRHGVSTAPRTARRYDLDEDMENGNGDVDHVDDDQLRQASYGGGAHVRLHQQTSPADRYSVTRRLEMSSGISKSRIRAGGGLLSTVQEGGHNSSSGGHKVTIKKDLAHLLF
jgi:hypothetical protein